MESILTNTGTIFAQLVSLDFGPEIHRKHDERTDVLQRAANAGGILTTSTRDINIDNNPASEKVDLCLEGRIAKLLVVEITGIMNAVKAPHRGDVVMSLVASSSMSRVSV